MTETKRLPILNTNLRWFLVAMILANIGGQMAYSLLSVYLVEIGASVGQVGLVFTLASLVPTALQILGGWFSDTIGRLRAIAVGSSIACIGYLIIAFAPSWEWVLVGLCIEHVSNSVVGPSFGAYIAEQSTEEARGRIFGLTGSIYQIVTVVGPALAGFLAYRFSFLVMLRAAFAIYALGTVVRLWMAHSERFTPERTPEKPSLSGLRTEMGAMFGLLLAGGVLTWIWITDAISDIAMNLSGQLYPVYMKEIGGLNVEQIGLLNAVFGGASILASFASGWITDRWGERASMALGFGGFALGLASMLQAQTSLAFLAAMAIFGLGAGCLGPAYNSLVSKVVPEDKRGLAYGLFGTSLGILSLPFPWIGAQLWERFAPQTPFWISAASCLVVIPMVWLKFIAPNATGQDSKKT